MFSPVACDGDGVARDAAKQRPSSIDMVNALASRRAESSGFGAVKTARPGLDHRLVQYERRIANPSLAPLALRALFWRRARRLGVAGLGGQPGECGLDVHFVAAFEDRDLGG